MLLPTTNYCKKSKQDYENFPAHFPFPLFIAGSNTHDNKGQGDEGEGREGKSVTLTCYSNFDIIQY